MRFPKFQDTCAPNAAERASGDRQSYIERVMKPHFRPTHSTEEINAFFAKFVPEGTEHPVLSDKFTEEEKAERYALSREMRMKYAERTADGGFAGLPSTNRRYPEQFMMDLSGTPEAREKNEHIRDIFRSPAGNEKELIRLHLDMIRLLETKKADELARADYTDRQIVDKSMDIFDCSSILSQTENMRRFFKENNIVPTDDESREMMDEINTLTEKYTVYGELLAGYTDRIANIENPYYAVIDPSDPGMDLIGQVMDNDADGIVDPGLIEEIDPEDEENVRSIFEEFYDTRREYYNGVINGEINQAEKLLLKAGVPEERLVYRVVGKDGTVSDVKPMFKELSDGIKENVRPALMKALFDGKTERIELFDEANAQNAKIDLFPDFKAPVQKAIFADPDKLPEAPAAPEKVGDPGRAPEAPGRWQRFWHTVSFGLIYRRKFNDYNTALGEYNTRAAAYGEYQEREKAYGKELSLYNTSKIAARVRENEAVKTAHAERRSAEEVIGMIEKNGVQLTEQGKENIAKMRDAAEKAEKNVSEKSAGKQKFPAGRDASVMVAYAVIEKSAAEGKIGEKEAMFLNGKEAPEKLPDLLEKDADIEYVSRSHSAEFCRENLLSGKGLERLADKGVTTVNQLFAGAGKAKETGNAPAPEKVTEKTADVPSPANPMQL